MDYFNKRGGVNFKVVAIVMSIVSFGVAILIYAGVSEVVTENADFNCLVGNRLANLAGATSNPCRTTMATIEQIDFNKDLTIKYLECPQYEGDGRNINTVAQHCGEIKVVDKGIICWINYMSGKGNLQTSTCYNLCMKPSYGHIEANERGIITSYGPSGYIIPLEFKGLTTENLRIFEDDGFNAENRQHINQLTRLEPGGFSYVELEGDTEGPVERRITLIPPANSKLSELEIIEILDEEGETIEAIYYERSNTGDVTIVIEIPFQDITVHDLARVFKNSATTTGGKKGEKYTDRIDKDALRMNTVSYYDQGIWSGGFLDTNIDRPSTDNEKLFTISEDESWIIQYQDSEDWLRIPFVGEASDVLTYFDTDVDEDSLNYAYNGVC
tara:strand:- start:28 stop:1182 length:1155 start_codon:yes stop_codon:yes gene_type:complete